MLFIWIGLAYTKSPQRRNERLKPGKCWQWETYLVHNWQCAKPHSQDRLLFITYKNALGRYKQHIYSKCNFQSFGMVGCSLSLRLFMSKIPVISHYTMLEYCTAKKKKLNNKNQMKTKLHNQNVYIKEKRNITVHYIKTCHFIKLYKFVECLIVARFFLTLNVCIIFMKLPL